MKKFFWIGIIVLVIVLLYMNRGYFYKMFFFQKVKQATEQVQKHIPSLSH